MSNSQKGNNPAVIIIGAGVSGICTAIDLIKRNGTRDFVIVERGNQVGGTWNDNKYPGCCCDVWSHLYSLSFDPNPDWSREYSGQEEIHQYLISIAQKWGLYQHIRFNTSVSEARWQGPDQGWQVSVNVTGGKPAEYGSSYALKSQYLVSAVGQLNTPSYPEFVGLADFGGVVLHSARWDWSKEMENKRIGVIGNGATAAQLIPELAKVAKSLVVFQRTPNWVIPRADKVISERRKFAYRHVPTIRKRYRESLMDFREGFHSAAVLPDSTLNKALREMCTDMMKVQLLNKANLQKTMTPDYPPGCKRIIISDDFYPALDRDNVTIETRTIQKWTDSGIQVEGEDTAIGLDVIVLATGFKATEFMYPIKIFGQHGQSLQDIWSKGPKAHLGVTVESLPNFAMLYGPNTNLGHNSIILMIEAQSRYLTTMISKVMAAHEDGANLVIVPNKAALQSYNDEIQSRLSESTFADNNCRSWYKTADGLIANNWCGTVVEYQKRLSHVVWSDYDLSGNAASKLPARSQIGRVVEESVSQRSTLAAIAVMTATAAAYLMSFGLALPAIPLSSATMRPILS